MKTRAAVSREAGAPWEVTAPGPDAPRAMPGGILITNKYALDEINDGYQDLMDGKNIRGVVVHQRWCLPGDDPGRRGS